MQKRDSLALFVAAIGAVAALVTAPLASADEYGGGGAGNPLLPGCETMGGSSAIGGQSTDCATPGNSQLTATPNDLGVMGGMMDEPFFGFGGW
ncbi:MAG: hypothetical protein ACOYBX_10705 [Mycobacterium sp.]